MIGKKIKNENSFTCSICGKKLVYQFEIDDGICEECMIKLKETYEKTNSFCFRNGKQKYRI